MSGATVEGPVRRRRRPEPVLVGGALLILLQTIVRVPIVINSYYWHDDFLHVEMSRRLGLSQEFLVRDHGGHVEVGANLVYWLIGRDMGLSFAPAAACLLVLQFAASCLLLAVLRELFGPSRWILLPFAGYLFTPLALPAALWWAAGLEALPLQIGMLSALLALVRAVRRRSWRWAAVSVLGHAFGLFFWEKAVLILPTLVVVLLLVEWAAEPLRARLRRLAGALRFLLPHAVLLAGYLVFYLSVADPSAQRDEPSHDVLGTLGQTVFRMLLPGIFGGPWSEAGAASTVYPYVGNGAAVFFAVLFAAVVAASLWLRGARALQAWLLVAGYVAVDLALLQLGRGDFIGVLARDPRYVTDALLVIAIGLCAAFTGPGVPGRTPRWFPQAVASADSPLSAIAVLVASCLLTTFLVDQVLQDEYRRNYVHTLAAELDRNPDVSVVSTPVPISVSVNADHEGLMRAVGREMAFDQPSTDMRMVDPLANLRPVTVVDPTLRLVAPDDGCGWTVSGAWRRLGSLPATDEEPQILQIGYLTGQVSVLHVSVGGHEQAVALPVGYGYASFVVTDQAGPVKVRVDDSAGGGACVPDLVAGGPWPAD